MTFLTEHCRLDGPRPGFVVEQHNELFYLWGEAALSVSMPAYRFEVKRRKVLTRLLQTSSAVSDRLRTARVPPPYRNTLAQANGTWHVTR